MLFGRRKPGFSKEVELKPEDITDAVSDHNDPASAAGMNPKSEKAELAAKADAVAAQLAGEALPTTAPNAAQTASEGAKVDLFDYMDSLPEVDDPFPPSAPQPQPQPQPELTPCEVLAEYIRERTRGILLTAQSALRQEEPALDALLAQMQAAESCADIHTVKGEKDVYYYSSASMTDNYAMIAMLVLEKNLPRTIAELVRFNCKIYPSPTPLYYFMHSPYFYTKTQLEQALRVIERSDDMADIQTLTTFNQVLYLYSVKIMSKKYAQALANDAETSEGDK